MKIKAVAGNITEVKADAIVLPIAEETGSLGGDLAAVDRALGGVVSQLIGQGEIKGKPNEITLIHTLGKLPSDRVVIVGLGKPAELSLDKIRGAIAEACRLLRGKGIASIATTFGIAKIPVAAMTQAITEGALLGLYTFRRHITKPAEHGEISQLIVVGTEAILPELEQGIDSGRVLAEATNLARDMANEPANYMTPTLMAETAARLAEDYGLELNVLEQKQMEELGMGALIGVAKGSRQPPKFIILRYPGGDSDKIDVALVGKGVTFDAGGISIKPSAKMEEMKGDMAGGAAVMAAMAAIARFKPQINVMAAIPATENLPDGSAIKPGDVLTAMNGKTIEIISTDAEGRLILADALSYVKGLGARRIIDVATLTGACVIALGNVCSGVMGNHQELLDWVIKAGDEAGELIWQMPMYEQYKELNKSEVADIKNIGGRYAGTITAAQFLDEFVGDTPWAHLDIAGTSLSDKERGYLIKGATGVAVRTLVNLVLTLASKKV
ncbi:MAG: leucyl aminopeptidase [Dehalococcoidales bacterium]|nr:leucyl aminopeptidase [Dehalococcoidales bacterium]